MLGSKDANLELTDGDETVVVTVIEVDEAHGRAFLARLPVPADAGVLQKQIEDVRIVLQQPRARKAGGESFDNFVDLVVLQPGIDNLEPLAQHGQHHHLVEAPTMAVGGELPVIEVEDLPAKPGELIQQRFLDVVALVHAMRLWGHGLSSLRLAQKDPAGTPCGASTGPACPGTPRRIEICVSELPWRLVSRMTLISESEFHQ